MKILLFFLMSFGLCYLFAQEADTPSKADDADDAEMTLQDFVVIEGPTRDWRAPNYSGQENALGYNPTVFEVPKELEVRVNFWKRVYTEVTSQQGFLHDKWDMSKVYKTMDFSDLYANNKFNAFQIERERKKRVKAEKNKLITILKKLAKVNSPEGLSEEELAVWKLYEGSQDSKTFLNAAQMRRLRFQLGQKEFIFKGLYQSGRYLEQMEEIFKSEGLPIELTRLPFVESSFNLQARSRVGASGIWQLMPRTVRRYVRINYHVDERNDPLTATKAAARIFQENFVMLPSWPLAVTAYNQGAYGIKRRLGKYQATTLGELIERDKTSQFGFAGENFYSSFLAVLSIEKEATKYFKNLKWAQKLEFDEIVLTKSMRFGKVIDFFGGNESLAEMFNPHLNKRMTQSKVWLPKKIFIRVPKGMKDEATGKVENAVTEKAPEPTASEKRYRMARGETLSDVAQNFGVTVKALLELNEITDPRKIREGQWLNIPDPDKKN